MIRFISDLLNHIDIGKLKLLYTDTDSYHFGLAGDLDDLVKDNMRESWFNDVKPRTFIKDPKTQSCTPGTLLF